MNFGDSKKRNQNQHFCPWFPFQNGTLAITNPYRFFPSEDDTSLLLISRFEQETETHLRHFSHFNSNPTQKFSQPTLKNWRIVTMPWNEVSEWISELFRRLVRTPIEVWEWDLWLLALLLLLVAGALLLKCFLECRRRWILKDYIQRERDGVTRRPKWYEADNHRRPQIFHPPALMKNYSVTNYKRQDDF